ncbi:hypothetical protein ACI8B_180233 [Acinetobacter proteolyticus]|uniref:Uncharacterized protein n=1 Tax=Acinetobacter proteolyticus TaxID=1776741 RepID=A0A653K3D5_9GAMM|nr:hypothetical protein ACI8B_180233 [Acinetobacter proteolyticus]
MILLLSIHTGIKIANLVLHFIELVLPQVFTQTSFNIVSMYGTCQS